MMVVEDYNVLLDRYASSEAKKCRSLRVKAMEVATEVEFNKYSQYSFVDNFAELCLYFFI